VKAALTVDVAGVQPGVAGRPFAALAAAFVSRIRRARRAARGRSGFEAHPAVQLSRATLTAARRGIESGTRIPSRTATRAASSRVGGWVGRPRCTDAIHAGLSLRAIGGRLAAREAEASCVRAARA
jgi:hypothetical protein